MKTILISILLIVLVISPPSPTATFTLSFSYAARKKGTLQSSLANVLWNDDIVLSVTPSDYNVHTATVVVTAVVGQNFLQFEGAGASDNYGLGITDMTLIKVGDSTNTNVLVNGDFMQPYLGYAAQNFNSIPGWTAEPGSMLELGTRKIYNPAWSTQNIQLVQLDSYANFQMTQTLTFDSNFVVISNPTTPACTASSLFSSPPIYTLTFAFAPNIVGTSNLLTSQANVLWNGDIIDCIIPIYKEVNTASFQVVVNPCGSNYLQFDGSQNSDGLGLSISNVQLTSASGNPVTLGTWTAANPQFAPCSTFNPHWSSSFDPCFSLDSGTNQRYTQQINLAYTPQKAFDIVGPLNQIAFGCLGAQGYTYATVRADSNTVGVIDPNAIATLQNARASGLSTGIYMILCPGADPVNQVNSVIQGIDSSLYNVVWFKLVTNSNSQCLWSSYTQAQNCQFLTNVLQGTNSSGITSGIFTTANIWNANFGTACSFGSLGYVHLWYADYQTNGLVDPTQSFADFTTFGGLGGWTQPDLKQIIGSTRVFLCNNPLWHALINIDWHL